MAPKPPKLFIDTARTRCVMRAQGVDVADLARRLGVTELYMHKVVAGSYAAGSQTVQRVADALGVPVSNIWMP